MLTTAANSLVRILLAPACAACGQVLDRPLASPVCEPCWHRITSVSPPWCARCGDELGKSTSGVDFETADFPKSTPEVDFLCGRCQRHPPQFELARSAGRYEGPMREIVHAFKFEGRRLLAEPLGRMMRFAGADVLEGADAVIPVPLHPIRAVHRGFNQADDLARQLGLPVWRALRRSRHGPPQASLPAGERQTNLQKSFRISSTWTLAARLRRVSLHNRVVVVVDDVMTTGATVDACSRVLVAAGVTTVRVLTAARAVAGRS